LFQVESLNFKFSCKDKKNFPLLAYIFGDSLTLNFLFMLYVKKDSFFLFVTLDLSNNIAHYSALGIVDKPLICGIF
jgi:hypothetical protein